MSNAKAQMSNQIQSSNPHDWLVTTNDENIDLPTPPAPPPSEGEGEGGGELYLRVKCQNFWKFGI